MSGEDEEFYIWSWALGEGKLQDNEMDLSSPSLDWTPFDDLGNRRIERFVSILCS